MTEQSERPAASDRDAVPDTRSPFERFVEVAHLFVTRPAFFYGCLAVRSATDLLPGSDDYSGRP
jgi:hypothetical protein